jgi:hypothetical protein
VAARQRDPVSSHPKIKEKSQPIKRRCNFSVGYPVLFPIPIKCTVNNINE